MSGEIRAVFAVRSVTISLHGSRRSFGSEDGVARLMSKRVCQKARWTTGADVGVTEFGSDSLKRSSSPFRREPTIGAATEIGAVRSDGATNIVARWPRIKDSPMEISKRVIYRLYGG